VLLCILTVGGQCQAEERHDVHAASSDGDLVFGIDSALESLQEDVNCLIMTMSMAVSHVYVHVSATPHLYIMVTNCLKSCCRYREPGHRAQNCHVVLGLIGL
jgi:hypothetical protein